MVFGASYAAAHDHDDHTVDFDGECVVCAVTALNAVKLSPDEPPAYEPGNILISAPSFEYIQPADRFNSKSTSARSPPLFVPSL